MENSRYKDSQSSAPESYPEGKHRQTAEELYKALHELRIYQIELEMQNEELRATRDQLEESHDMYVQLYDCAPVGYATLTNSGCIRNSNLTLADMLHYDRLRLIGKPFTVFVAGDDVHLFFSHLQQCAVHCEATAELRLISAGKIVHVQLKTTVVQESGGELCYQMVVIDIDERKKVEATQQHATVAERERAEQTLQAERQQNRRDNETARIKNDRLETQLETRTTELAQRTAERERAEQTLQAERQQNQRDNETARIRNDKLETQLETKTNELAQMALQFVEKYEWVAALEKKLQQLVLASPSVSKRILQEVLHDLHESLVERDQWEMFEQQLSVSNRRFLHDIAVAYPTLTPTELKICCLLRLNLSTKDIARLFYTSRKTIENHRYRIRKKLNLPSGDNLTVFLLAF